MGRVVRSWQFLVPFLLLLAAGVVTALTIPTIVRPAAPAPPSPSATLQPTVARAPASVGTPDATSADTPTPESAVADLLLLLTPAPAPPSPTPEATAATSQAGKPIPTPTATQEKLTSVLLLGYGGEGHPGSYLTDAMILAVLNPTRNTLVLLSVPRDTWVYMPIRGTDGAWGKLNTAYAYGVNDSLFTDKLERYSGRTGGGNLAKDVTSNVIGYPIQHYAAVDFATFAKAIDEIGGVDVDVASSFTTDLGSFAAGRQHLNGTRVLLYARVRKVYDNPSESSDFARSRRQRQIVTSFLRKLTTLDGLLHAVPLLRLANEGLTTNYRLPAIGELPGLVGSLRDLRTYEAALTTSNYLTSSTGPGGTYILLPAAGAGQWGQVRAFVRALLANPELGQAMANNEIEVLNAGSGASGAALREHLQSGGYRVSAVRDAAPQAASSIVAAPEDAVLAEGLRASLEREGIVATVALTGKGNPVVTFGADWRARRGKSTGG